jgi:uncharacterized protein (TIGR00297 family)
MPSKTISPARDRLQSNLLVWIVAPFLGILAVRSALLAPDLGDRAASHHYLIVALAISLAFTFIAWLLKAATPAAAACGGVICLLLTNSTASSPPSLLHSGLPPLVLLFALTFSATRFGRTRKEARGLSEPRTGRRASQVIANLGIAGVCAACDHHQILLSASLAYSATIAALAEATADTLSSEIGQAVAGPAFLISNFRRVSPGTDGAISLVGTLAGLLGAAAVTFAGLPPHPFQFPTFAAIFAAATLGLFFDSLLGATFERRGYIGNDLVNFASTAFAAAILYPIAHIAWSFHRI